MGNQEEIDYMVKTLYPTIKFEGLGGIVLITFNPSLYPELFDFINNI